MKYTYHCAGSGKSYQGRYSLQHHLLCVRAGLPSPITEDVAKHGESSFSEAFDDSKPAPKEVIIQSKGDEFIAEYDSVDEAAKALGKKNGKHLEKVLAGSGSAYGFDWSTGEVEE